MRFPQTFIDDLRRQTDIVRVVSDYVSVKKKGTNWMACCPFHQEKTPSFSVNPSKDIFYCFGCQKGGSVFTFVMEMERVSFPEAVRIVAEKAGVPMPAMEEDKKFEARRRDADEVIQLNSWALEWWEAQLQENNPEARAAREYLEGRTVTDETRQTFRLGFAPNSWEGLGAHLKARGASAGQIERSGLVVKKDAGGFYDRFRGRVIFPVLDAQGRPVAFGARGFRPGDEPKYLNSPETAAYTKGRHLYGLNWSRDDIRRKGFAILVEGYLDLIIPFQAGVQNVVASLGTALTPEQVRMLARFARKIVVNYDGDRAGRKAAKRAIDGLLQTLLSEEFDIKILVLPNGADPDEFIRSKGVQEYNNRRGQALSWIQYVIDQVVHDRSLLIPEEKDAAIKEVLSYIRIVPLGERGSRRREYFDIAMDMLHVAPALHEELWQTVKSAVGIDEIRVHQQLAQAKATTTSVTHAEKILLELLLQDAELRREFLPHVEEADYEGLPTAGFFRALREVAQEDGAEISFDALKERLGDGPLADLLPQLWMAESRRAEGEALDSSLVEAESCLVTLRLMKVEKRLKELAAEIAAAERAGDEARRDELIMESLEWQTVRTALLAHRNAATAGG